MPTVSLVTLDGEGNVQENSKLEFQAEENHVIWEELERLGQKLPAGCLAGSCGTCRILVIEGEDNLNNPSAVEADTIAHITQAYEEKHGAGSLKGRKVRLSCRARIKGDVKFASLKE